LYGIFRGTTRSVFETDDAQHLIVLGDKELAHTLHLAANAGDGRDIHALLLKERIAADEHAMAADFGDNTFTGHFFKAIRRARLHVCFAGHVHQRPSCRVIAVLFRRCGKP